MILLHLQRRFNTGTRRTGTDTFSSFLTFSERLTKNEEYLEFQEVL